LRGRGVIWCHDYHLMFLPKCLNEHDINMRWFLHTPFLPHRFKARCHHTRSCADLVG
uniref:Uncharacterized protein n=1 Tax=Aegilops tauschii subsp. strangulata TaxID=200361 RepID=A0A453C7W6_AEGTS